CRRPIEYDFAISRIPGSRSSFLGLAATVRAHGSDERTARAVPTAFLKRGTAREFQIRPRYDRPRFLRMGEGRAIGAEEADFGRAILSAFFARAGDGCAAGRFVPRHAPGFTGVRIDNASPRLQRRRLPQSAQQSAGELPHRGKLARLFIVANRLPQLFGLAGVTGVEVEFV